MDYSYDIFLSHSSKDKHSVRELAENLRAAGLRVWYDEWAIKPGDVIYRSIDQGLDASRVLILCLSQASMDSDWAGLERETAIFRDPANTERRFIPVLLEPCELPDTLKRYKYIDYRNRSPDALKTIIASCSQEAVDRGSECSKTHPVKPPNVDRHESVHAYCVRLMDDLSTWQGLGAYAKKELAQIYVSHFLIDKLRGGAELEDFTVLEDFLDAASDMSRIMVEGNPGSGKTMLLRHWAVHIAEDYLKSDGMGYIPVYLPLGWLGRQCGNGPWTKSLIELAALRYIETAGWQSREFIEAVQALIKQRRIVVLLDAIDEVSEAAQPFLLDWLSSVRNTASKCPLLLSSRPCDYTGGIGVDNKLYVRTFNKRQRDKFIENWFKEKPQTDISSLQSYLQSTSSLNTSDVIGNPLFLTMICVEFENRNELSSTPARLLDQFVQTLLGSWDKERRVQRTSFPVDLKMMILEAAAAYLFDRERNILNERELVSVTREILNQQKTSPQPTDIIQEILDTSGLLMRDRTGCFQFCHILFQEYFMARDKMYRLDEAQQKRWLQEAYFNPKYEKVLQFYQELKFER